MTTPKRPILFYIGNFLILFSFGLSIYIYYPIIRVYVAPPRIEEQIDSTVTQITIPKIHAQAPIILNVDPWNEDEYREKLQKGVAHANGTAEPGMRGTSFLFAHSSDSPWNITRYNTAFFRLSELEAGDEIFITKKGKKISYKVFQRKEVGAQDIKYLKKNDQDQLILQTCTPIGTDFRRLLIFAKRV